MAYRLRDLREDADLTQAELAQELFLYPTQYRRYESGESDLPLGLAIRIADRFHVSLDRLAGRAEEGEHPGKKPERNTVVIWTDTGERIRKRLDDRQIRLLLAYLELL